MGSDQVNTLFVELIDELEADPSFDVERFLGDHDDHAAALRQRMEKLRRAGFLGSPPDAGHVLREMRERFGVSGVVHTARPGVAETRTAAGELLPSRVVGGRYRILAEIGRGGMGRVFRALDIDLGREVALKVVDLDSAGGGQSHHRRALVERFLTEAQLTAQLEHPSIVPLHDIGIDRTGQLYYTMKLVEGHTLEAHLRDWHDGLTAGRTFPVGELLRIVLQICDALGLAHERGVIHRDLKPSNVMVGRFGEVHVMDWGVAKLVQVSTSDRADAGTGCERAGTPTHMAPEQASGDPTAINARTDVYGVGAILHHALTAVPPNRAGAHAPGWRIPTELRAICARALRPEPSQRYASVAELAADLRAFLQARRGTAWRDGPLRKLVKLTKRRPAAITAMAGSLLLALAAALGFALRREGQMRVQEEARRADAQATRAELEHQRAENERERATITILTKLLTGESGWNEQRLNLGTSGDVGVPEFCEAQLTLFREADFAFDGPEPVADLLHRMDCMPLALRSKLVERIETLASHVERLQLFCVMQFCHGRFPREVSAENRGKWEQMCRDHPRLLAFLPRLDEILNGLVTDPWRRSVWDAYRARRRDRTPWPEDLVSFEPSSWSEAEFLGMKLAGDPERRIKLRAAELLEAAVEGDPQNFWLQFLLGTWKAELPEILDLPEAIEHLYRAAALSPQDVRAWSNLGGCLLSTSRNEEASVALQFATRLVDDDAFLFTNLGEALQRLGRFEEALAALDRSIELDPSRPIPFLNRALVMEKLGRLADAEADLCRATQVDAGYTKAWAILASVREKLGRFDEALEALDKGLEFVPDDEGMTAMRARLGAR